MQIYTSGVPVWALIISLILPALYCLPAGYVLALTGQTAAPINVLVQVISGYLFPGRPVPGMVSGCALLVCTTTSNPASLTGFDPFPFFFSLPSSPQVFKSFSVETLFMAGVFSQSMKLGHYIKIPPRNVFTSAFRRLPLSLPRSSNPSRADWSRSSALASPTGGRLHVVPHPGRRQKLAVCDHARDLHRDLDKLAHVPESESLLHRFRPLVRVDCACPSFTMGFDTDFTHAFSFLTLFFSQGSDWPSTPVWSGLTVPPCPVRDAARRDPAPARLALGPQGQFQFQPPSLASA